MEVAAFEHVAVVTCVKFVGQIDAVVHAKPVPWVVHVSVPPRNPQDGIPAEPIRQTVPGVVHVKLTITPPMHS